MLMSANSENVKMNLCCHAHVPAVGTLRNKALTPLPPLKKNICNKNGRLAYTSIE